MESSSWKKNKAPFRLGIFFVLLSFSTYFCLLLFIIWHNQYYPLVFISNTIFDYDFVFIILLYIFILIIFFNFNPIKYRLTSDGIEVKYIQREPGIINWADISFLKKEKILKLSYIKRKSTPLYIFLSLDNNEWDFLIKKIS